MTEQEEIVKPTEKALLKAFKADIAAADTLRLENVANIERWAAEYEGKPYGNEVKGKSHLVSRDIKRQDEWQHASIKDPFVADPDIIKCNPVTPSDVHSARQNQLVLNYQFARKFDRYNFMTDVIKLHYKEGTVIVKTGWKYEDEVTTELQPIYQVDPVSGEMVVSGQQEVKTINVIENHPDAQVCRVKDCYYDPTCEGDIDAAQFFAHRYESDLSTLRKSKKHKNLDKLIGSPDSSSEADFDATDDTEFKFTDDPRKKLLVYEYFGNYDITGSGIAEPIACTWVGDTIISIGPNPYPGKKLPFLCVANNSTPFKLSGEASAELIGDNQKISTAIKRGILDNVASSNNAQKGVKNGALDELNTKRYLNGKNFVFNGNSADFFQGNFNQLPGSILDVLSITNNETESLLGVKGFGSGIDGASLGSTATAARGALDAVSVRRLDIIRNLSENLIKPLMRKWMCYNSKFLKEEEVIRITEEEFVPVKRDDLKGNIDIQIDISTAEDNAAKAQDLSFTLQTGQQTLEPGIRNIIQAKIFRLKGMPDLAKQVEEYKPEPDPYVEEMRMLEMEKLKAEIRERNSRAEENATDIRMKTAKAVLDEAKARELNSGADLKDLEFTQKVDGTAESRKMVEKQHDRETAQILKSQENLTKR